MSVKLYASLAGLDTAERERLEFMIAPDTDFRELVDGLAELWRTHLRSCSPNTTWCRRVMLARTALLAARHPLCRGRGHRLPSALALAITDRVEERVDELDREEQAHAD